MIPARHVQRHRLGESRFCKVDSYLRCLKHKHFVCAFCAYIDSVPPSGPSLVEPQGLLRQKSKQMETRSKGPASNHAEPVLLLTGCSAFSSTCIISVNSKYSNLETVGRMASACGPSQLWSTHPSPPGVFPCLPGENHWKPCSESPSVMADLTPGYFLTLSLMMEVMHAGNFFFSCV